MNTVAASIECPFTWNLDKDLSIAFDENVELQRMRNGIPLMAVMNSIMVCYSQSAKKDYEGAKSNFNKVKEMFQNIDERYVDYLY